MSRVAWVWAGCGLVTILLLFAMLRPVATRARPSALTGVFEQEIVRATTATGGRVAEVKVREGDAIEAGTVILRLEDGGLRDRYQQARALANRAESQIEAASFLADLSPESVQQLLERNSEVQAAEREYVTAVAEAGQAGASVEARRRLDRAAARREEVRAKVSRRWHTAFQPGQDLALQVKQELKLFEDQLAAMQVTAPTAGTVEILRLQPGDFVLPGQPVVAIAQAGGYYVDVYASPDQLSSASEGTEARVRIGTAKIVWGRIQSVSRTPADFNLAPSDDFSDRLFRIRIGVTIPPSGSRAGMPATVWLGARSRGD